uniref:Uncharacterized protein n=1 Tax=Arundo donax TaxID=35708 RepID=A0A0A8XV24_ARUDO
MVRASPRGASRTLLVAIPRKTANNGLAWRTRSSRVHRIRSA